MKTISAQMYGAALDKWSELTKTDDILEELKKCEGEQDLVCTLSRQQNKSLKLGIPTIFG